MKFRLIALIIITCFSSLASAEVKYSAGIGAQYGMAPGVKIINTGDVNNYYLTLSLAGAAVGFDRPLTDSGNTTFGFTAAKIEFLGDMEYFTANISYHASGYRESGFVIGLDAGVHRTDDFLGFDTEEETEGLVVLSVGYNF